VFGNWLAAAPIVAIGAPFGALIVSHIGRRPTLVVVAVLCVVQFLWTMEESYSDIGLIGLVLSTLAVGVFVASFEWMWKVGERLARRSLPVVVSPSPHPDE
jgi:predicted MFS family arabinose efflux permease